MKAVLITIGDEILNGDTIDSNSAFIAQQLSGIGIKVHEIISVGDEKQQILDLFERGLSKADIVITTGGLGPTKDDLTKECFAEYFSTELVENQKLKELLTRYYTSRGFPPSHVSEKMISLPKSAQILRNNYGVAPGMVQHLNDKLFISLPGVPFEMKGLMTDEVLPLLGEQLNLESIQYHYFMTAGQGETVLEEWLQPIVEKLPSNLTISYLPSFANVKVRLTGLGVNKETVTEEMQQFIPQIREKLSSVLYSELKTDSLVTAIAKLCKQYNRTISTAESCTGGNIAHEITSEAGSSDYFLGSIISYANRIKVNHLNVSQTTLNQFGAVSEEVAEQMVRGALKATESDYAVATTGIAGPTGGTEKKPVGLVCVGVGNHKKVMTKSFTFTKNRVKNIQLFTMIALNMLYRFIKEQEEQTNG